MTTEPIVGKDINGTTSEYPIEMFNGTGGNGKKTGIGKRSTIGVFKGRGPEQGHTNQTGIKTTELKAMTANMIKLTDFRGLTENGIKTTDFRGQTENGITTTDFRGQTENGITTTDFRGQTENGITINELKDLTLNGIKITGQIGPTGNGIKTTGFNDLVGNKIKTTAHPKRFANMRTGKKRTRAKKSGQDDRKMVTPRTKASNRKKAI